MIDFGEHSHHRTSDGSDQDSPGNGSTCFNLLDIPFNQPPRRGNEDDETIPGVLDAIDEAETTPERRATSLPSSRVAQILKPYVHDVAQRLDLNQADHGQVQQRGSSSHDLLPGHAALTRELLKGSLSHPA